MRFALEVGNNEKSCIEFFRNWYTGNMRTLVTGREVAHQSLWSLSTYFSKSMRRYEFAIGQTEPHTVVIEDRELSSSFFRAAHGYRVFVDGQLVHEQTGY